MLNLKRAVVGAFQRNSSAISFLVLAFFIMLVLSTVYLALFFTPAQFENLPEVREYDNMLENVSKMDDFSRTQFYWANNLKVAGVFAVSAPFYFGANAVLFTGYNVGLALVFNYNNYGPQLMLAFASEIFLHGVLELTGIFIVGAASFRIGWKIWEFLGSLIKVGFEKKSFRKSQAAVKQYLVDYTLMIALGSLMIFFAAPIEAYVSPVALVIFFFYPPVAIVFLAVVILFYASIVRRGFMQMRRVIISIWKELKTVFLGKWRPAQLSFLMLVIFSLLIWFGLIF